MSGQTLIKDDARTAEHYTTYSGVTRPNPFVPRGPDLSGRTLYPVTVEYFEVDGMIKTRVGWTHVEPRGTYME